MTLPTLTFSDRVSPHLADRRAELIHVGPAHTTNDVVVWLPDEKVLFAGDVVLNGCTPFNLMGSIRGGLTGVERLRELGAATVVCGHGPVAGPQVFDETADYLRWILRLATEGRAEGLAPLEVVREADLGGFAHLIDPERIVGNLHRAYAEMPPLDGTPDRQVDVDVDVMQAFHEMVEFNDGRLPTCLA